MWRCTCGAQLCSRHASRLCWYVMAYKPSLNKPGLHTMPLQRLLLSHLFSLWFPRMFFSIHLNIPQSRSASGAILFEASHLLQRCSTERLPLFSVPVKTTSVSEQQHFNQKTRPSPSVRLTLTTLLHLTGQIFHQLSDVWHSSSLLFKRLSACVVRLWGRRHTDSLSLRLIDSHSPARRQRAASEWTKSFWNVCVDDYVREVTAEVLEYTLMLLYSRDSPLINICSLSAHHDRGHHDVVFCWIKGSLQWSDVIVWPHQTRLRKPWRSRQGQKCKLCFWPESSCFIFHLWELFIFDWTFVQSVTQSRVWFYTLTYFNINTISLFSVNWLLINH